MDADISHHRQSGGFQNPWPHARPHGLGEFLKWRLRDRAKGPRRPIPPPASFTRAAPTFLVPAAPASLCTVTWVGHTSFLVQLGGKNILLDPVWSNRASPISFLGPKRWVPPAVQFDTLPPIEVVVISHDHYDHLDRPTVQRLVAAFPEARWVAPLGVGEWLRRHHARVHAELDWWQTTTIEKVTLACTPAQHFSGRNAVGRNTTLWSGWVLRHDMHTMFFAGDTAYHPEFSAIATRYGPFDAVILPIGAYEPRWFMGPVHMNPDDAVQAYADLVAPFPDHPCTFIASHWGTFKLTDEPMNEPPRLTREAWQRHGFTDDRLWIAQHGETKRLP